MLKECCCPANFLNVTICSSLLTHSGAQPSSCFKNVEVYCQKSGSIRGLGRSYLMGMKKDVKMNQIFFRVFFFYLTEIVFHIPVNEKIVRSLLVNCVWKLEAGDCVSYQLLAHVLLKSYNQRRTTFAQRCCQSCSSFSSLNLSPILHQVTHFDVRIALSTCPVDLSKDLILFSGDCIPQCCLCLLCRQLQHCYLCAHGHALEKPFFCCCSCCLFPEDKHKYYGRSAGQK